MSDLPLSEEQIRLLELLVEAARKQEPDERAEFHGIRDMTTHRSVLHLLHPGISNSHPGVYPGDVQELADAGLLRLRITPKGNWVFDVTALGYQHYGRLKERQAGTAERAEETLRSYLDLSGLAQRHPAALAKLREAEQMLWPADSPDAATTIGHLCREAHQAFATSLLSRHPSPGAPSDLAKPKTRVGAVLAQIPFSSESVKAYVVRLGDYWESVVDLAERQEHAGLREGERLLWEDSRRLVFATLFAMTEIDRVA